MKGIKRYSLDEKLRYYEKRFYDLSLSSSKRSYAKKRYLELEKIKFGKKRNGQKFVYRRDFSSKPYLK